LKQRRSPLERARSQIALLGRGQVRTCGGFTLNMLQLLRSA